MNWIKGGLKALRKGFRWGVGIKKRGTVWFMGIEKEVQDGV